MIECVGELPTAQQAEALWLFPRVKFLAIRSGHGVGKTRLLAWLVNWWLDTHKVRGEACRVPVTGAASSGLADTIWTELKAVRDKKMAWLANRWEINQEAYQCKENPQGWFATLRTARREQPDALQGFHRCMYVIDEGSGVPDEIFEVARGAMGDPGSMAIMTGNPTRLDGEFHRIFHVKKGMWHRLWFNSEESLAEREYSYDWYVDALGVRHTITRPGLQTGKWVKDMEDEYGRDSNVFKVRVRGEFAAAGEETIIPLDWIDRAFQGLLLPKDQWWGRTLMGVDVAHGGMDDSALVVRRGDVLVHAQKWHGADTVETAAKVKLAAAEYKPDKIMVDRLGVGAGVYDTLSRDGFPVVAIAASENAPEDRETPCKSVRDWLWWRCRQWFRTRPAVIVGRPEGVLGQLRDELHRTIYDLGRGELIVESKEKARKRNVPSPNIADALVMTFWLDAAPADQGRARVQVETEYAKKKRLRFQKTRSWKTA